MDLDYNSYPDLAVGSLSDSVFVYKCVSWRMDHIVLSLVLFA